MVCPRTHVNPCMSLHVCTFHTGVEFHHMLYWLVKCQCLTDTLGLSSVHGPVPASGSGLVGTCILPETPVESSVLERSGYAPKDIGEL